MKATMRQRSVTGSGTAPATMTVVPSVLGYDDTEISHDIFFFFKFSITNITQ